MLKQCPACERERPFEAKRCACGHEFPVGEDSGNALSTWGKWLLVLGSLAVLISIFGFDPAVETGLGQVNNLGLLQQQMMIFQGGLVMALAGIGCICADAIRSS